MNATFMRILQQPSLVQRIRCRCSSLWSLIRELATDDAYERYIAHHQQMHADAAILSRRDFYVQEQQRKWSGIQRCC